ncbi:MAG: TonB-dependent receptor [Bryobacterales bacterium]|nr:TonB-dependent receptor [Bryobacterales bacterium]
MRSVFALFATVSVLLAQSSTQTIEGVVSDSTGAVIEGAKVTATNVATGVTSTVSTNTAGAYAFPLIPVGNYDVKVELSGFKTGEVRNLRVETAAQVRQDFQLQVGQLTETVEVSATAALLNTENSNVGGVIENKRIIELPLNGRNVVSLATLVPGVQFGERTGRGDGLGGFPIPGQGFSVSANGVRETFQVVSLDGVDAKDPRIHITNFVPSVEALEEFKIQTNAYSAEYGFGGGAVVNMTMKSGTNSLHGTLFEFLRNDKLDAENYFLNFGIAPGATRNKKDKLRRNQFGLVVSGPLIRNRTFWAFNWESRRDVLGNVQTAWFPQDQFRNGIFTQLLNLPTNPATGRPFRNPIVIYDPYTGVPFPGNILPQTRIHAGAKNVIGKFLPRADFSQLDPLDFTVRKAIDQPISANQYFGRVDHYFNERDRVFGRIAIDWSRTDNNYINPNFPVYTPSHVANLATQWVHTFNQRLINEARFGFNISNDNLTTLHNQGDFDIDSLGIGQFRQPNDGNRKLTPREQGVPLLGFTIGERINGSGLDRMATYQMGDHLSYIRNTHTIKMGAEVYRISMQRAGGNLWQGSITFSGNETGLNFASFLMGLPNTTQTPEGESQTFTRATRAGAYINDDWKVTKRLTLNLGFRWDYVGVPSDAEGLWRTFDFVGEKDAGRGAGYQVGGATIPVIYPSTVDERGAVKLWTQRPGFFMPRIGFAFRPAVKWVIRAGAGWFDNVQHLNTWSILALMPPKSGSLLYTSITDTAQNVTVNGVSIPTRKYRPGAPILTLNDPFLTASGGTAVSRPVAVLHIKPDTKDGDVWKWNFDIQRELPKSIVWTIGYVSNKGTHTGNSIGNFNDALPSTNTDVQSRRPFQSFYDPALPANGIQTVSTIRYLDSYGNSFYHALQTKVDKRFAKGLSLGAAYTYSKAHGDGEAGGNEGAFLQDPRNRAGSRGLFRFDQTHVFAAHYVWELPGAGLRGPLKYFVGGWQSNGIVSLRSGFPFTPSLGNDLNTGSAARPDRISDGRLDTRNRQLMFDPNAFQRVTCNIPSRPDLCHFGNSGVGIIRDLPQHNLDFSLFKNFEVIERVKLQFRSEFFNAFNTPYFGDPTNIGFISINSITPDAPRVGEVRGLRNPMRIIQFGLKLFF